MQIQSFNQNNPNFTALHIANAGELKLYKITSLADKKYLKTLPNKIKTSELMPGLSKQATDRWNEMLEYAVNNAQDTPNITYLETFNNKPCGILTFSPCGKTFKLNCICTWPVEFGQKIKLAGKTLFYQLFKDFQNEKGRKIELEAITNGPFDTVKKYEELGFKQTSSVYPTKIIMETNAPKAKNTLKQLDNIIDYKPVDEEIINLSRDLD